MFVRLLKIVAPALVLACSLTSLFGAETEEKTVSLSTQDGWALSAVYRPASSQDKTVVLLHDLNKKKEDFSSFKADLALSLIHI